VTFNAVVLEHFRRPLNRGEQGVIRDARFHADACALCIASASLLTEHVRGRALGDIVELDDTVIADLLKASPPPGRRACARLPLDTLQRAANRLLL
jgi:NifU-like protein involved in Fe-S cluster formation